MIIFVCILFLLALIGAKPILGKLFYSDYASVNKSRSVNGIFIILILLSHTFAKVSVNDVLDAAYNPIRTFLGQFVVVPFLFYSGFGIMESISKKKDYLKAFPKKRFLKLFLQFFCITLLYILLHLCLRNDYSITQILLSFVGITSIGNGGWYMLSTFTFYISVILCFHIFKNKTTLAVIGVTICILALMAVEMILDFPSYYYSTTLFLAVGMIYALIKNSFDKIFMRNNLIWVVATIASIAGFIFLKQFVEKSILFYPIWCGFGMLMILFLTMKIQIQNRILIWLGKITFFIFTLQGIPQIIFTKFLSNNYCIYILTITCTVGLSFLADRFFAKCDNYFKKFNHKPRT